MPRKQGFNDYRIEGEVAFLALTNKYGEVVAETAVDVADLPRLREHGRRWCCWTDRRGGYLMVGHKEPATLLSRFLLEPGEGVLVDHVNGVPTDNRRSNLRPADRTQNACNRRPRPHTATGYKGVQPSGRRFKARIQPPGARRPLALGSFATPEEAARAYDAAARELFGAFACLNFPGTPAPAPQPLPLPLEHPA